MSSQYQLGVEAPNLSNVRSIELAALKGSRRHYQHRYEESLTLNASAQDIFAYADDFSKLSSHMTQSSGMMMGESMEIIYDAAHGQAIGAHVGMRGKMMGLELYLDEVVTEREPPRHKAWETTKNTRLLVIGDYRLGFDVIPKGNATQLRVFIDYDLPASFAMRWLGVLFGSVYAKWCVGQMVKDARAHFGGG